MDICVGKYLSIYLSIYLFSYGTGHFLSAIYSHITNVYDSVIIINSAHFLVFYVTSLSLVFLFSVVLSITTGVKNIWSFLFFVSNVMLSISEKIRLYIIYSDRFETFPSWVTIQIIESIVAYLIMVPLLVWLGNISGNKFRNQRRQPGRSD